MVDVAMLPHPVDGWRRHYGEPESKPVRVLGLSIQEGEDYWLVLDQDGRPSWAEFSMVTLSSRRAEL